MDLRETILQIEDLPRTAVSTPEWPVADGQIFVRTLTAGERVSYSDTIDLDNRDSASVTKDLVSLVVLTACQADGTAIFNEADVANLQDKNGAVVHRIAMAAQEACGMTKEALEDEEKNSQVPTADSPTS